jgi:hypothetical protein
VSRSNRGLHILWPSRRRDEQELTALLPAGLDKQSELDIRYASNPAAAKAAKSAVSRVDVGHSTIRN